MFNKRMNIFSLCIILISFFITSVAAVAQNTDSSTTSTISSSVGAISESNDKIAQSDSIESNSSSSLEATKTIESEVSTSTATTQTKKQSRAPNLKASKDWGDQFITHTELQDGNGIPQTSFGIYDNMQAYWEFKIPAGTDIKVGNTMTVSIPDVLTLQTDISFNIKDPAGNIIGSATANHTTGEITITFTDYAEQSASNGITGNFNIWVQWNHSLVEQNTTVPVNWGSSGTTNIQVGSGISKPDDNEKLYKWGNVDPVDPTLIHWSVRVNFAEKTIQNAIFKDTIGVNQQLVSGSVAAYHVASWNGDWTPVPGEIVPASAISEIDGTHFTINFGELKDCVYINYDTRATDDGNSSKYQNSGTLSGDNIETQTIDVYTPDNGGGGNGDTTVAVSGQKIWNDNNDQDGKRPKSIVVNLLANGQLVDFKTVTAAENWSYNFMDIPKYKNGKEIVYTITENTVTDYTTEIKGTNIINTYNPGKLSGTVTKHWEDNDDQDNIRPVDIKVQLYANDTEQGKPITLNQKNNWTYTWDSLNRTDSKGTTVQYSIKELAIVTGYTATINGENTGNLIITNKHTPKKSNYSGNNNISNTSGTSYSGKNLPKTGENSSLSVTFSILGKCILLLIIILFPCNFKKRRVDKSN
ncbi:Cna B-type domain-containing protein [Enterococcus alishanensis]